METIREEGQELSPRRVSTHESSSPIQKPGSPTSTPLSTPTEVPSTSPRPDTPAEVTVSEDKVDETKNKALVVIKDTTDNTYDSNADDAKIPELSPQTESVETAAKPYQSPDTGLNLTTSEDNTDTTNNTATDSNDSSAYTEDTAPPQSQLEAQAQSQPEPENAIKLILSPDTTKPSPANTNNDATTITILSPESREKIPTKLVLHTVDVAKKRDGEEKSGERSGGKGSGRTPRRDRSSGDTPKSPRSPPEPLFVVSSSGTPISSPPKSVRKSHLQQGTEAEATEATEGTDTFGRETTEASEGSSSRGTSRERSASSPQQDTKSNTPKRLRKKPTKKREGDVGKVKNTWDGIKVGSKESQEESSADIENDLLRVLVKALHAEQELPRMIWLISIPYVF